VAVANQAGFSEAPFARQATRDEIASSMASPPEQHTLKGGLSRLFVEHRLLGWLLMIAVLVWGGISLQSLPQQEDPSFPRRVAVLVTLYPDASAEVVEKEITSLLEENLSKLPALEKLESQSWENASAIKITLKTDHQEEIKEQWDQVREILKGIKLPEDCELPELDTEFQNPVTLLFAVHGDEKAAVESASDLITAELKKLTSAGRIRQFGNSLEDLMLDGYSVSALVREENGPLKASTSVLIGVEMKEGQIIRDFKNDVLTKIDSLKLPAAVRVATMSDQPATTAHRIHEFFRCFLEAVIVVVLVTLLLMDWRTALVVAVAIPLTISMTLGGMAALGVPLQQISIAALILALGMLVDDPVVASDGINRELADGQPHSIASWLGPFKLRRAIFFGTVINIVAFLPLILLPDDMGAFIVSLPIVVTLALVSSRIVSMTFIPLLGYYILRGQKGFEAGGEVRSFFLFKPVDQLLQSILPRYKAALQYALHHPIRIIVIAYGLLLASTALTPFFAKQFFPHAERNQLLVDIKLPADSSIEQTQKVSTRIRELLQKEDDVLNAAIVSGGGIPMFYYNEPQRQPATNIAQALVNTRKIEDVPKLIVRLREVFDLEIQDARCIVKLIQQGPPIETPIQIHLTGDDLPARAAKVSAALRDAGAYKVHDDLDVITHVDQRRTVTVKALAPFGELASRVLSKARPALPTTDIEFGGEEYELNKSQKEMQRVMSISLALIALAMVLQFRSLMKSVIVMLTVPLGLIGAFVGLATTHAAFGFMALIGIVSLAGVIVSHIIVLSDYIEEERAAGVALEAALMHAALVRLRAVLATVFATVCGLFPLAFTGGELWQPLTAVHIFGLLFGTVLTLLLLPVLYFLFARWKWIK